MRLLKHDVKEHPFWSTFITGRYVRPTMKAARLLILLLLLRSTLKAMFGLLTTYIVINL